MSSSHVVMSSAYKLCSCAPVSHNILYISDPELELGQGEGENASCDLCVGEVIGTSSPV